MSLGVGLQLWSTFKLDDGTIQDEYFLDKQLEKIHSLEGADEQNHS